MEITWQKLPIFFYIFVNNNIINLLILYMEIMCAHLENIIIICAGN